MVKRIGGVIAGYAVFVVSSLLLFTLSGQKPHAPAPVSFQILTAVYGLIFSLVSGLIVQLITQDRTLRANYVLGLLMAGFATFSLIKADGSHWTQLLAIFVFAPASILGGLFWLKQRRRA